MLSTNYIYACIVLGNKHLQTAKMCTWLCDSDLRFIPSWKLNLFKIINKINNCIIFNMLCHAIFAMATNNVLSIYFIYWNIIIDYHRV